jgi:hypothetical protein
MTPGFRRRGPEIDLDLPDTEREILGLALAVLQAPPSEVPAGPAPSAGYPHFCAHLEDDAAEARFQELTAGSLQSDREDDRRRFAASLDRGTLGTADAAAWLRVLAETRLALAARLGVVAEDSWGEAPPSPGLALLHLFGSIQDELAGLLLGTD